MADMQARLCDQIDALVSVGHLTEPLWEKPHDVR